MLPRGPPPVQRPYRSRAASIALPPTARAGAFPGRPPAANRAMLERLLGRSTVTLLASPTFDTLGVYLRDAQRAGARLPRLSPKQHGEVQTQSPQRTPSAGRPLPGRRASSERRWPWTRQPSSLQVVNEHSSQALSQYAGERPHPAISRPRPSPRNASSDPGRAGYRSPPASPQPDRSAASARASGPSPASGRPPTVQPTALSLPA